MRPISGADLDHILEGHCRYLAAARKQSIRARQKAPALEKFFLLAAGLCGYWMRRE
jgi:hypothetical protein